MRLVISGWSLVSFVVTARTLSLQEEKNTALTSILNSLWPAKNKHIKGDFMNISFYALTMVLNVFGLAVLEKLTEFSRSKVPPYPKPRSKSHFGWGFIFRIR